MHTSFLKTAKLFVPVFFSFLLSARAQSDSTFTIVTIERTERCPPLLLTAADSARERARLANARFLLEQPTRPVRLVRTTPAYFAPHLASGEAVDLTELQARAHLRTAEERRMMEQALSKRGRRQLAATDPKPASAGPRAAKRPRH